MINHTEKLRETEVGCSQKYGSSEIWSDNNPPNLRSLAKYHTENGGYGGVLKHTDGSPQRHSQCIGKGDYLPVLLAIYIQSVYPKKLLGICTLPLRRSLCHQHLHNMVFSFVPSVSPCALLYKCFNISLNILEEQKNPNRDFLYE